MNTTELYLKVRDNDTGEFKWSSIDLNDDMPLTLIYAIADVKDITRRNGSYSKTIRIPGTKNNNVIFSHIFDVSIAAANPVWNPNKKVRCYILRDTLQIFEGSFQIRNILTSDNKYFTYECVIYGENSTFSSIIKELYMKDLTNIDQLDHYYTYDNIVTSWEKDWTFGYYYPMINFGRFSGQFMMQSRKGPRVRDFKPAIYVKWLWDQIFNDAGFTYESNFLNSDIFKNLIIPNYKTTQNANTFWMYLNQFRVGLTSDQIITGTTSIPVSVPSVDGRQNYNIVSRIKFNNEVSPNGDPSNLWSQSIYEYTEGTQTPITPKPQTFYLNLDYTEYLRFSGWTIENEINSTLIPQAQSSPETLGQLSNFHRCELRILRSMDLSGNTIPGGVSVKIDNALPAYFTNPDPSLSGSGAYPNWGTGADTTFNRWVYLLGGFQYIYPFDSNSPGAGIYLQPRDGVSSTNPYVFESPISADYTYGPTSSGYINWKGQLSITLDDSGPENMSLRPGEKLWLQIHLVTNKFGNNIMAATSSPAFKINSTSIFFNVPENQVAEGGVIQVADTLPNKFKQIDFITSIVRMFNLFIETDKDDARNLFIEPRDDYYSGGVQRNWSEKLDISKEIKQDVIAELQNKKLIYTYKSDNDLLNSVYKQRFDQIYGQQEYIINNDFTTGEQKYEVVFSPTPLAQIKDMPSLIVPTIQPIDLSEYSTFNANVRILTKTDVGGTYSSNISLPINSHWQFTRFYPQYGTFQWNSYPYAGNLNHPLLADYDLNFGVVNEVYYPQNTLTNNTLFNLYHRKMINELTDRSSRLITAYFYLNAQDIARLRFNDTIFVDQLASGTGNYFRLNKIEYDPQRDGSYKVELLKILNTPGIYFPGLTSSEVTTKPPSERVPPGGLKPPGIGEDSRLNGLAPMSVGSDNNLDFVDSAMVVGNENYAGPNVEGVIITGRENKIRQNTQNSAIIGGSNNSIGSGLKNVIVIGGESLTITDSNRINFGLPTISATNYISASKDEVNNEFPSGKVVNWVSAGRDKIRDSGSYDTISIITAGRMSPGNSN